MSKGSLCRWSCLGPDSTMLIWPLTAPPLGRSEWFSVMGLDSIDLMILPTTWSCFALQHCSDLGLILATPLAVCMWSYLTPQCWFDHSRSSSSSKYVISFDAWTMVVLTFSPSAPRHFSRDRLQQYVTLSVSTDLQCWSNHSGSFSRLYMNLIKRYLSDSFPSWSCFALLLLTLVDDFFSLPQQSDGMVFNRVCKQKYCLINLDNVLLLSLLL